MSSSEARETSPVIADRSAIESSARPTLSVLIVGYRSRDLILDALDGLFRWTTDLSFEVLLTDNAQNEDGTFEAVTERHPSVRIIESSTNSGFAGGNNLLAEAATGDYLLLLNPDTKIFDDAVTRLVATAQEDPSAGAWGGMTLLADGRVDPSCQQPGPTLGAGVLHALGMGSRATNGITLDAKEPVPVPVLPGAYMLVRTAVWRAVGGFDTSFALYNEEVELCLRLRRDGYRPTLVPSSRITHLVGSNRAKDPRRILAMTKSNRRLDRKFHGPVYYVTAVALNWCHGASRYFGAWLGRPLLGAERARSLREAWGPIVLRPWTWWAG